MISAERNAEILRLHHAEHWKPGTIARQLGVHHTTVRRVLAQARQVAGLHSGRPSMADRFVPLIQETLAKYPSLRAARLYDMARARGYGGGPDHFRHVVSLYRPAPVAEAYLRLRTLPGEQAQVDWGHFGKLRRGRAERVLWGFVMVLSYSRQIFLQFFLGNAMANFLRGHVAAFESFAGVPRVLLYDNLRSAVLERVGQAVHFNPALLDLAAHYRFEPRPVAVARGNEKGRVERAIRYIRDSFFAAREFADLADLNAQATLWCEGIAAQRLCPEDRDRRVGEVFADERERLLGLPDNPLPCEDREEVRVQRTPYVRFDLNDYSVPHTYVRRMVVVHASVECVRVVDGASVIATHPRSWDKGAQIDIEQHVVDLVAYKRAARQHRGLDRLHHACSNADAFFAAAAARSANLGSITSGLNHLLDLYDASTVNQALGAALLGDAPHLAAVQQLLEQRRHEQHQPPPLAVVLPADPRLRDIVVQPHALATYDQIRTEEDDTHDDHSK